jgi:hypothetical protein
MCPHTTIYVSAYYYIRVGKLLPHTTAAHSFLPNQLVAQLPAFFIVSNFFFWQLVAQLAALLALAARLRWFRWPLPAACTTASSRRSRQVLKCVVATALIQPLGDIYTHAHTHTHIYRAPGETIVYVYTHTQTDRQTHTHTHTHTHMYVCMYVCMYIYMHIYIYYTYTYVCMYA